MVQELRLRRDILVPCASGGHCLQRSTKDLEDLESTSNPTVRLLLRAYGLVRVGCSGEEIPLWFAQHRCSQGWTKEWIHSCSFLISPTCVCNEALLPYRMDTFKFLSYLSNITISIFSLQHLKKGILLRNRNLENVWI